MKNVLEGLYTAVSLYSIIPVPRTDWNRGSMRYALCFAPVVGVVAGVLSLIWFELCRMTGIQAPLFAAVAVLLPILVSGGIHMCGFINTANALSSHGVREKKLEILRDSHARAFGVLFCAGQMLLSFGLWQQLYARPQYMAVVAVGYVVSRCLNPLSIVLFPTARDSGFAHLFSASAAKRPVVVAHCVVLAAMAYICARISLLWGGAAIVAAAACFLLHRRFCVWEFGGNTGDLAGFLLQNTELLFLAAAAIGGLAG